MRGTVQKAQLLQGNVFWRSAPAVRVVCSSHVSSTNKPNWFEEAIRLRSVMATSTGVKTLVVWDYDWSLINCNSDTFVVEQLRPDLYPKFREYVRRGNMVLHVRVAVAVKAHPPYLNPPFPLRPPPHRYRKEGLLWTPIMDRIMGDMHAAGKQGGRWREEEDSPFCPSVRSDEGVVCRHVEE